MVFVILQQVHDVACLFDVLDVREDLFLLVLVEAAHQVHGVVRVHVVHELLGDGFRGEQLEELLADVLVHLHQYVGCRLVVQEAVNEACVLGVEVVAQLGDVGRVQVGQQGFHVLRVFLLDVAFDLVNIFFVQFHLFN